MQISASAPIPVTFNAGLQGLRRANLGMSEAAAELIQRSTRIDHRGASDLATPLLAMKTNALLFEASGKVLRISNDNAGHLIDVLV